MDEDFDFSLRGSQVSAYSSARRPNSAKGSARTPARNIPKQNASTGNLSGRNVSGRRPTSSSATNAVSNGSPMPRTQNKSATNIATPKGSAREDFLALFENSSQDKSVRPKPAARKTVSTRPTQKKTKPAWASGSDKMNSARSTSTVASQEESTSKVSGAQSSKFSHSVFQPTSARSSSEEEELPVLDLERFSNNMADLNSPHEDRLSGRALVHNNDIHNSHQSQKSQKLNPIANNMTSQALSPGLKMSLVDMENSYQNIKHKMPVNQVKQSTMVGQSVAEDYIKTCNMAATKIQRWYRRRSGMHKRKVAGEAAMKRLLDSKRLQKEEELERERRQPSFEQKSAEERKRAREDRARQARQDAVAELHRQREQKRLENQKKAEEEIKILQASGKLPKAPSHKIVVKKSVASRGEPSKATSDSEGEAGAVGPKKPGQPDSARRKVDDIFQNNTSPNPRYNASHDASSHQMEEAEETPALDSVRTEQSNEPSQPGTKTTLDDLMTTLKKLEEEDKLFPPKEDKHKTPNSWIDDLEKHTSDGENADCLTADKLEKLNSGKDNLKKSGFLSDEKLKSIISFLDEVETAEKLDDIDQEINKMNEELYKPALLVPSGEELEQLEQASAMASEVTNSMLSQRLELDEKKRTVDMLKKALNQQRELTVRHARETEKDMKKRLDLQKNEYEETIKRHLSFIDQLIDDKKSLGEKCEEMVKEMKVIDKKYTDKIRGLQENHNIELQKIKEVHLAAEKLRREKWIDEKTKKIKEMTVKGLEPEIQRLIAKHKTELKKIKSIHEAELLESDERAGQRYVKMTEELRDQLQQEKEMACARERDLARQTYEKQMQQEEEAYQQQRRRLYAEVAEEKERQSSQAARQRAELDRLQRQLEDSHVHGAEAMKKEYDKAREEQERRHTTEIRQLKEQLTLEKAAWEESYMKKQETWLLAKERELKEQVRRDRDKEIELVIQRLEDDNQGSREECERVAENRIKRIRDKYEGEISELERNERLTSEKYNRVKAELADVQGENERKSVVLKQKDREVQDLKKLLEKLNNERDHVSDVIRQEFADRIVATEEESRRLKNEMSELKSKNRLELEKAKAEIEIIQKTKEEEMEEVHKRVKQAILKKEEVVTQLKQQYQAACKRADHLEGLLEQQRKQLLKK